jgi:hypothetical protein
MSITTDVPCHLTANDDDFLQSFQQILIKQPNESIARRPADLNTLYRQPMGNIREYNFLRILFGHVFFRLHVICASMTLGSRLVHLLPRGRGRAGKLVELESWVAAIRHDLALHQQASAFPALR